MKKKRFSFFGGRARKVTHAKLCDEFGPYKIPSFLFLLFCIPWKRGLGWSSSGCFKICLFLDSVKCLATGMQS